MDKIETLLRKISGEDRAGLKAVINLLIKKQWATLNIKKLQGGNFYRARKGEFRIIFTFDKGKETIIFAIKTRDEKTYKF